MTRLSTYALATALGTAAFAAHAIEEPAFSVERQYDGFELRAYPPVLVAEVTVAGPAVDAGNQGFRILAGYIFGKNKGEREIAMTAPVTQAPEPAKIAMTAPVTQAAAYGGYTVQFTMPAAFTLATLPEPLDARIRIKEIPGKRYAVIRHSGFWSDANYQTHLERLGRAAQVAGVATQGGPGLCALRRAMGAVVLAPQRDLVAGSLNPRGSAACLAATARDRPSSEAGEMLIFKSLARSNGLASNVIWVTNQAA